MKLLGAIIAGGRATRFGSDKGAALLDGRALIDHVAAALRPQVDALLICGREWPGLESLADRPEAELGPLGGLCAALHAAQQRSFDAVLTAGCDTLPVPLLNRDVDAVAQVIDHHWLFGLWPATLAPTLDDYLATTADRSMRGWTVKCGARIVPCDTALHNLNTPTDFALYSAANDIAVLPTSPRPISERPLRVVP